MNWLLVGGALAAGALLLKKKKTTTTTTSSPIDTGTIDSLFKASECLKKGLVSDAYGKCVKGKPKPPLPPNLQKLYTTLLNCLMNPKATGCRQVLDTFYFGVAECMKTPNTPICKAAIHAAITVVNLCGKHPAVGACPEVLKLAAQAGMKVPAPSGPTQTSVVIVADKPKITLQGLLKHGFYLGAFYGKSGSVMPAYTVVKTCNMVISNVHGGHCDSILQPGAKAKPGCSYKKVCTEKTVTGKMISAPNTNVAGKYLLEDWCLGNAAAIRGGVMQSGTVSGKPFSYSCPSAAKTSATSCVCGGSTVKLVKIKGANDETLFFAVNTKDLNKLGVVSGSKKAPPGAGWRAHGTVLHPSGPEKKNGGGNTSIVGGGAGLKTGGIQPGVQGCGTGGYYSCND